MREGILEVFEHILGPPYLMSSKTLFDMEVPAWNMKPVSVLHAVTN